MNSLKALILVSLTSFVGSLVHAQSVLDIAWISMQEAKARKSEERDLLSFATGANLACAKYIYGSETEFPATVQVRRSPINKKFLEFYLGIREGFKTKISAEMKKLSSGATTASGILHSGHTSMLKQHDDSVSVGGYIEAVVDTDPMSQETNAKVLQIYHIEAANQIYQWQIYYCRHQDAQ